jgi:hypothetical protein
MEKKMKEFKLSDESIAHIAKILQIAILSGTDIVDHLRLLVLTNDGDNYLVPSDETKTKFDKNIEEMMRLAEQTSVEE